MRGAISKSGDKTSLAGEMQYPEGRVSIVRWNPKGMRRSTGPQSMGDTPTMNRSANGGQGRVRETGTKAFSFTHQTKVFAGSTVRKNNA
jgi:hypothetical protein